MKIIFIIFFELILLLGIVICIVFFYKFADNALDTYRKKFEKAERYKALLIQWLNLRNTSIADYLISFGVSTVAIYGYSEVGKILFNMLSSNSKIETLYYIDQKAHEFSQTDIVIYTLEDELPEVDAIVVVSICDYDEIEIELRKKTSFKIISLEDIVYNI